MIFYVNDNDKYFHLSSVKKLPTFYTGSAADDPSIHKFRLNRQTIVVADFIMIRGTTNGKRRSLRSTQLSLLGRRKPLQR
jgi:hypothetical protein